MSGKREEDLEKLKERQIIRYMVLKGLYDLSNGRSGIKYMFSREQIAKHTEIRLDDVQVALEYLDEEGLTKMVEPRLNRYITHKGIIEVEKSIENPNYRTEHFARTVIQYYFYGRVGSVQGENSTAVIKQE